MTDAAILAIATAVPPTVAALAALIVSMRTKTEVKTEVAAVKAKADAIAGSVDGAATKSAEQITSLQKQIAGLLEDRAEKKQIAALAAQAQVATPRVVSMTNGVSVKAADGDAHLGKIEKNTADTATNTAKTDATVNELKKET